MLYISKININLLSIIALNRREFIIFFKSQRITITNQRINSTITHKCAINDLYKLTNSISNKAFIFDNIMRSNNNKMRLIEAQISEVLRVIELNDIAESRDIAKSRDIRLKEY